MKEKKKSKSVTKYVLKDSENHEHIFDHYNDAQIYSWIYHNDFPTFTIYKRTVRIIEELMESGTNEIWEDNFVQAEYKRLRAKKRKGE